MAFRYLARYSTSSVNLHKFLLKKLKDYHRKQNINEPLPPESLIQQWEENIAKAINHLENLGYLNDLSYAQYTAKKLVKQGKSKVIINLKLKEKGLEDNKYQLNNIIQEEPDSVEIYSIIKFIKKKRFAVFSIKELDEQAQQKQMASLYRQGFDYNLIKKVLKWSLEEMIEFMHNFEHSNNL
jgi:SOS response regulatory protein OraA/RecX